MNTFGKIPAVACTSPNTAYALSHPFSGVKYGGIKCNKDTYYPISLFSTLQGFGVYESDLFTKSHLHFKFKCYSSKMLELREFLTMHLQAMTRCLVKNSHNSSTLEL